MEKKQKTYDQVIAENDRLRENNAYLVEGCKAFGGIVRILEKEIFRLKNMRARRD